MVTWAELGGLGSATGQGAGMVVLLNLNQSETAA
jgi:hypothetical protein